MDGFMGYTTTTIMFVFILIVIISTLVYQTYKPDAESGPVPAPDEVHLEELDSNVVLPPPLPGLV